MHEAPLWIFAYGSLMWRPDFAFAERHRATVSGYHRALCIWSHHYRGTVEKPGLVFGLDVGGDCIGVAFRIAPEAAQVTLDAVRLREQVTGVYREIGVTAVLDDGRTVEAVAYAADPAHEQYAGRLALARTRDVVSAATGVAGPNSDYVCLTQAHLHDLGIEDAALSELCAALGCNESLAEPVPLGAGRTPGMAARSGV